MRYSYGITSALLAGGAAISLITGMPAGAQVAQNDSQRMTAVVPRAGAPASFAELTDQVTPAVVNISTRQRVTVANQANPFSGTPLEGLFGGQGNGQPATREAQSLGSGFLISADGYIVTNNHVIQPPETRAQLESVTVTLTDGSEYEAEVVGRDPQSDLAVLKIERREAFPFVRFGNSNEARVGDWVVAIGQPFGLGGTVTAGIVSAVVRQTGAGGAYDRYIQTDASINRGNSGGPLFDMQGNVIGINNAIYSPSGGSVGIGFAIPAETASPIVQQLIRGEEIVRGYIGVRIQPMNEDLAAALGIPANRGEFVQSVQPGEPAEQAGLQAGDVVVTVDGKEVTREQTLSYIVANIQPGARIELEVLRDGQRRRIPVTVGRRPSEEQLQAQNFSLDDEEDALQPRAPQGEGLIENSLGVQVIPLTPQIAGQVGVPSGTRGLVVAAADPSADAAQKGISRGAVIVSANGRDVASAADLEGVLRSAQSEGREAVLLRVIVRGSPAVSIPVRLRRP